MGFWGFGGHRANAAQAVSTQQQVSAGSSMLWGYGLMLGIPVVVAIVGGILISVGVIPTAYQVWVSFAAIGGVPPRMT